MVPSSNDAMLYVVMNGRAIGEIQRTGKRSMRLRYVEVRATICR